MIKIHIMAFASHAVLFDHRACPRRFLSAESIEQFRNGSDPAYILGRVIFMEPKVADDDTIFPVPVGETYYLLTAAVVESI